jgi:outer membrane protein OmpA-like peptidoglycan-associated protein
MLAPMLALMLALMLIGGLLLLAAVPNLAQQTSSNSPRGESRQSRDRSAEGFRYGLFVQGGIVLHTAAFDNLPPVRSCCGGLYGSAVGNVLQGGIFGEIPFGERVGIALRGGVAAWQYIPSQQVLFSQEQDDFGFANSVPTRLRIRYETAPQLLFVQPDALLFYRLQAWQIYAGASATVFYIQRRYEFRETLIGRIPENDTRPIPDVVFTQTGTDRIISSGNVDSLRVPAFGVTLGISYELPLNSERTVLLGLEAFGTLGISNLLSSNEQTTPNRSWQASSVRLGASLRFAPVAPAPPTPSEPSASPTPSAPDSAALRRTDSLLAVEKRRLDSIYTDKEEKIAQMLGLVKQEQAKYEELKKDVIVAKIPAVRGVMPDGSKVNNPTLRVQENITTTSRFVLNYVFFDENSSQIPERYERIGASQSRAFRLSDLTKLPSLKLYHQVLNIVGKRMMTLPSSSIRLVGCNANDGVERGRTDLSKRRAEAVKRYLMETFGIEPDRITVESRNLPEQATLRTSGSTDAELAAQEHRRVEIYSATPELFQRMSFDRKILSLSPPVLEVDFDITAGQGLKQWSFEAEQFDGIASRLVKTVEGGNTYPKTFIWDIAAEQDSLPDSRAPITMTLEATDKQNLSNTSRVVEVPVERVTVSDQKRLGPRPQNRIEQYEFFSFAYGGGDISSAEIALQNDVEKIKNDIPPNATVTITGYTDARGDNATNSNLATQRAESIARLLALPNVTLDTGGERSRYDNRLPEGRFYNRSVLVRVEVPINRRK